MDTQQKTLRIYKDDEYKDLEISIQNDHGELFELADKEEARELWDYFYDGWRCEDGFPYLDI